MTATKGFITAAATSALDSRKADGVEIATSAAGLPRLGVLGNNPSIVTADASTAPMRVAVAAAGFVTQRVANDGVAIWTNDGTIFVTVTKPGSNSWYVTLYAKHNDSSQGDTGDAPIVDVVTGAAAATPVEASLPAGALKIATILVPSTATSTQSAGVVITNVYQMTTLVNGTVDVRNAAELAAWTPAEGNQAWQLDAKIMHTRVGTSWFPLLGGVYGFCRRTTTALSAPNGSYGDISATAAWTPELGGGMTYANGFTVPLAGLYQVEWSALIAGAGGSGIMGIAVNGATPNGALLYAPGILASGGAVFGNGAAMVRLNAGDTLKLWGYGNGSALTLNSTADHPATHWGARWVAA